MPIDITALRTRIQELAEEAERILGMPATDLVTLAREYQTWYSQACLIVKAHLPERLDEFEALYLDSKPRYAGYSGIRSYFREGRCREFFGSDLQQQRGILLAIPRVLELRALEVAALVTADLVQGELTEARLLLEHGFIRAAGAVAGVALEAHLKLLHEQAHLPFTEDDTIVPLATRLRTNSIITLGDEKKCIAMADTRNKCDHKKREEPTDEEVAELIDDADRFTKRVQVV